MAKYTDETLDTWRKPASETEEQKISNAISMIKDAINAHDALKNKDIEFIVQGSYGNGMKNLTHRHLQNGSMKNV